MRKPNSKRCSTCRVRGVDTCEPCKFTRRFLNALHRKHPVRGDATTMAERVELYAARIARGKRLFEAAPVKKAG